MFFGESMFSAASGGSKVALAALAHRLRQWDWPLIDAQVENGHLLRLGAESWPRPDFIATIGKLCRQPAVPEPWTERFGELRSEEHTSELQSLMRISYAVFCLQKKKETSRK